MDEITQLIVTLTRHEDPVVRQAATESAGKLIVTLLSIVGERRADSDTSTATTAEAAIDDAWIKLRFLSTGV